MFGGAFDGRDFGGLGRFGGTGLWREYLRFRSWE